MPIFPLKPLLFGTKNICSIAFRYKWYQKTAIPCGLAAKKSYILRYYVNKKRCSPAAHAVRDSGIFSQKHHLFCKAFNSIYGKCRYTFNHNRYLFHKIEHIRAEKGVPMDQTQAAPEAHITYYGGKWVAFAPILLAIVGLIYIAVKQADVPEYWVVFLLPMIVCLFLAKDKTAYCEAIIEGATNKVGGILIMAVLLAGICGQLIETSGLVDTLAHYLIELNFLGNKFVAASFLLTCLIAFSTGTSVGTIFVVGPILYPIGYLVGATPALMIGAIVSGAAFGDNVSPVSDTLIAASSSQKVDLGGVFRSRLKYVLPAAALTLILYLALGSRGEAADLSAVQSAAVRPTALLFLLVPVVVVVFCLLQRHLLEALSYGIVTGVLLGLVTGTITFSDIISVPEPLSAGGLIMEGIEGAVPTILLVMLLFAQIHLLEKGGCIDMMIQSMDRFIVGPRSAEGAIVAICILLNVATGLNTAAIVGTGPLAKRLGEEYQLHGYRTANLLICSGGTLNYLMPYMVPVVCAAMMTAVDLPGAVPVSTLEIVTHQFYPILLLVMTIFAIVSGYGRTLLPDSRAFRESERPVRY